MQAFLINKYGFSWFHYQNMISCLCHMDPMALGSWFLWKITFSFHLGSWKQWCAQLEACQESFQLQCAWGSTMKIDIVLDFSMPWGPLVHSFCICSVVAANVLQNHMDFMKNQSRTNQDVAQHPRCVGGYIDATSIFLEIWWNIYKTCGWPHLRCVKDRHWIARVCVFFKEINVLF